MANDHLFNSETGRKAGQKSKRGPDKVSIAIKEKVNTLLEAYTPEQMIEDLMELKPKDRLWVLNGLCEYIMPKMARIEVKGEVEKRKVHVIEIDGEKTPV